MRRAFIRSSGFAALLAGLVAVSGCAMTAGPTPTPTASSTPTGDGILRIGTLFPTSGTFAFLGPAQTAGVNAAIREINAAGGVNGAPVEVVNRDSGDAASEKAEQSFAELVEKGVDLVIGPSSSVIAERLLAAAAEAGIPLISPAATYPQLTALDESDVFFRTIPAYGHQGLVLAALLAERDIETVTLIYRDDDLGRSLLAAAEPAFAAAGIELTAVKVTEGADVAAVVDAIDDPDAVVLATPDNGDQTKAFIGRLTAAELGGERLWLTSQNLADYSQALPAGLLRDVNGILEGADVDDAFRALIKQEDPAVADFRYAAEAYDATILAALAAIQAGDDGGTAVAAALRAASVDGIKCTSFGECLDVLITQTDIDYDGVSGSANLDENGDPVRATYGVYRYTAENKFQRTESVTG
jgi:branched-chain amino acid transport system substrate-binding protein